MSPRTLFLPLFLFLAALPAAAQLDLPDAPAPDRRKPVRKSFPGLELPSRPPAPRPAPEVTPPAPATPAPEPGSVADAERRLAETRRGGEEEVARAVLGLGEAGRVAARARLASPSAPERLASVRVLLAGGSRGDRDLVLASLRERVPSRSATPLLAALAELDPVAASPDLWIELLDHPQGSMRSAAAARLEPALAPEHLPRLEQRLSSRRADTRILTVELLGTLRDARATELLISALADRDARVAGTAAEALARLADSGVVERLLALATDSAPVERSGGYAVLALVHREDSTGTAIFTDAHTDVLLRALADGAPLSVGAAACALAGIGFRAEPGATDPWYDLLVPHHLVRTVAGTEFHEDLISLRPPALRRLRLVTGRDFGADGRAWQEFWTDAAREFRGRRARLSLPPSEAERLAADLRDDSARDRFTVYGEAGDASEDDPEAYVLSKRQCVDLYRVLEREGVFTAQRLPSLEAAHDRAPRELVVRVDRHSKRFAIEGDEPWFDRVAAVLRALREQNRWQRYVPASRRAEDPAAWAAERAFWSEDRPELERARRLEQLILSGLEDFAEGRLDDALEELEHLWETTPVADASDCAPLAGRLAAEPFYSRRVSRLVDLAITAARAERTREGALALDGGPAIDGRLAQELAELCARRFGTAAVDAVARLLAATTAELARAEAESALAPLRAGAAGALAGDEPRIAGGLLFELLSDPDSAVEAAAVGALGRLCARLSSDPSSASERRRFADELVPRARTATGSVRVAALHALARSGDDRAMGAMMAGLTDAAAEVRRASAEGLARLEDPQTVPVLLSLLARGPEAVAFAPARDGLVRLGPAAHDELLRLVHRDQPGLSREAALILAEGGVAAVASPLLKMLTEDPDDERVAFELAVLTCVDHRGEPDPASAWWTWWDGVRHGDAEAWLFAAGERLGLRAPAPGSTTGAGSRAGLEFLLDLSLAEAEHLKVRARRDLVRLVGDASELPSTPAERRIFLERHTGGG